MSRINIDKKHMIYFFGLQRSGTTYSQGLISNNFDVLYYNSHNIMRSLRSPIRLKRDLIGDEGGDSKRVLVGDGTWKHLARPNPAHDPTIPLIITAKNPVMWIESISYRKFVNMHVTAGRFGIREKSTDPDLMIGDRKFNLINMSKIWKDWYENWLIKDIDKRPLTYYYRYEQMLIKESREKVLEEIQNKFNLVRQNEDSWWNAKHGDIPLSKAHDEEMQTYYKSETPKYLNDKQISIVKETIGEEVLKITGYDYL
jgi:hypothetical protein